MFGLLALASAAMFGEIYGDIRVGDAYLADAKVHLACGGETADATTDKSGSFRLRVKANGKCQLTVEHDKQSAMIDIVLFEQPAKYRFLLEQAGGKSTLKRV